MEGSSGAYTSVDRGDEIQQLLAAKRIEAINTPVRSRPGQGSLQASIAEAERLADEANNILRRH